MRATVLGRRELTGSQAMSRISLFIAIALVFGGVAVAAEDQGPTYDPEIAYAETDRNKDGMVDREEFHHRMVEVFFHADRDKDGFMSFDELRKAVAFPDDFKDADTNNDGKISLYEFIRVRFHDYDEVDTDSDGLLSVDEVRAAFRIRGK